MQQILFLKFLLELNLKNTNLKRLYFVQIYLFIYFLRKFFHVKCISTDKYTKSVSVVYNFCSEYLNDFSTKAFCYKQRKASLGTIHFTKREAQQRISTRRMPCLTLTMVFVLEIWDFAEWETPTLKTLKRIPRSLAVR